MTTDTPFVDPAAVEALPKDEPLPLDPSYPQKALQSIRAVVRGNGAKPEEVELESFSGFLYPFQAWTHLRLRGETGQRTVPGRERHGEVMEGPGKVAEAVQTTLSGWSDQPAMWRSVTDQVMRREDRGFFLDRQTVALPALKKEFVAHEGCPSCNRSGKTPCPTCQGRGGLQCTRCQGRREMPCPACFGRKTMQTARGQEPCSRCHGRGRLPCTTCHTQGQTRCTKCAGMGFQKCLGCAGSGWRSLLVLMTSKGDATFQWERDKVPEPAAKAIESLGARLLTQTHADIGSPQPEDAYADHEKTKEPGEIIVPYSVRLPFGEAVFRIQGKPLPAYLFGLQVMMIDMPPFLETLTAPGIVALQGAAAGQGDVAHGIREAARYRMLKEAVMGAATLPLRKAAQDLHRRYAIGVRVETVKQVISAADRALKQITRKPRLIGLALGMALTGGLDAAYFPAGGRASLFAALPLDGGARLAIDAGVLLIGGGVTTLVIQLAAVRALRTALAPIVPSDRLRKMMPKPGKSAIAGYLGAVGLYAILLEVARRGGVAPEWYAHLFS